MSNAVEFKIQNLESIRRSIVNCKHTCLDVIIIQM